MTSTHTSNIHIPALSSQTQVDRIILEQSSASLLFIGQLCDNNCIGIFHKTKLYIFKHNKIILQRNRNQNNRI